jgi:hypothetical protein
VYFVRLSDSSGVAKVRVTGLQSPTATSAGRVSLEYAIAPNGSAAFGTPATVVLDLTSGARSLDFQTGEVTSDPRGGTSASTGSRPA